MGSSGGHGEGDTLNQQLAVLSSLDKTFYESGDSLF